MHNIKNAFKKYFGNALSDRAKYAGSFGSLREEYSDLMSHPNFNFDKFRIILSSEQLSSLPIQEIAYSKLCQLQRTIFFNPSYYYDKIIPLSPSEVGHDLQARYVCYEV